MEVPVIDVQLRMPLVHRIVDRVHYIMLGRGVRHATLLQEIGGTILRNMKEVGSNRRNM
eukprot:CAMPEP_0178990344 /NCGR_PEP_ID=MMETSP0795-20121207/4883_1 /TAXON_ID=88552 /ORGANISM="Amoebophrya sp., Strain Ameob2" /LENGTH=58 /DNA_ID=CAMNT_0020681857 /DNA_START=77 /DNA_END=250 /DNA_ORIENTATION=-